MKRVLCFVLTLVLLVGCLPLMPVSAANDNTQNLHASQALINKIKQMEGFARYPIWDYGQYSVGYGSRCPDDKLEEYRKNGITEKEAEALLKDMIAKDFESAVKGFAARNGLSFNQHEFDALVSFTYNLGAGWTSGDNKICIWLKSEPNTRDDLYLVNAMSLWCRAGGSILPALVRRRIDEARMFLYGDYTGARSQQYYYIVFNTSGVSKMANGYDDSVTVYYANRPVGELPTPANKSGYTFLGWFTASGQQVTSTTVITRDTLLYARWKDKDGSIITPSNPGTAPEIPDTPELTTHPVFKDVSVNSWYYDAVSFAYDSGLFSGVNGDTFAPNGEMNRAMMVTVLWSMAGKPEVPGIPSFDDVPLCSWYEGGVLWAELCGITAGVSPGKFAPNTLVTREQMVTFLYSYYTNYLALPAENLADLSGYQDVDMVSNYAKVPMQWAVGNGIISGMGSESAKTLGPRVSASRAQVATMMMALDRLIEAKIGC